MSEKSKKSSSGISSNGYLAFLDVLGFSEMVARGDFHDLFGEYEAAIREPVLAADRKGMHYRFFSDSIIIYTMDCTQDSLLGIIQACSQLLYRFLKLELPLKGSISCGEFQEYWTSEGRIVAGIPMVEAYRFEQKQDWVGIMLCPSVNKRNSWLKPRARVRADTQEDVLGVIKNLPWSMLVNKLHIPFRRDSASECESYEGLAIIPSCECYGLPDTCNGLREQIESFMTAVEVSRMNLEQLRITAPNPDSQHKHTRTIAWLESLSLTWIGVRETAEHLIAEAKLFQGIE